MTHRTDRRPMRAPMNTTDAVPLAGPHVVMLVGQQRSDSRCWRRYALLMSITPHIVVQGAERAVAFYRDAFGAEEVSPSPFLMGG